MSLFFPNLYFVSPCIHLHAWYDLGHYLMPLSLPQSAYLVTINHAYNYTYPGLATKWIYGTGGPDTCSPPLLSQFNISTRGLCNNCRLSVTLLHTYYTSLVISATDTVHFPLSVSIYIQSRESQTVETQAIYTRVQCQNFRPFPEHHILHYYTSLTSHWLKLNHMTWNNFNVLWKLTQTGINSIVPR